MGDYPNQSNQTCSRIRRKRKKTATFVAIFLRSGIELEIGGTGIPYQSSGDHISSQLPNNVKINSYPNPLRNTYHIVRITATDNNSAELSYTKSTYNLQGQLMDIMPNFKGDFYNVLSSNLPNGIYYLIVKDKLGNEVYTTKLVLLD